jgi:eukaryotic-like serine/threonine-protein kinase
MPVPTQSTDLLKDRYRLLDVVGEGGMAVVWRAEDELLGRTVAVKVLRPQYANDPEFLARLRSEARAAAALSDPGVVGVFDVGEDAGRHFIVMEYVAGRDLKAIIRAEGAFPPQRAVTIGAAIARAVGRAHAAGMVHRDIKPQNVLIGADDRVKVADFGIARAMSEVGTTAPGIVLGTVHYLAPELAAGGGATPASDVYSLGVVLYEMLTGRLPFDADSSVGVAMKIMNDAPEPVEQVNPRVPAALARIVQRAMARSVGDRYPDANSLADDLDGFAHWSDQATVGLRQVAAGGAVVAHAPAGPAVARPRTPTRPPSASARSQPVGLSWRMRLPVRRLRARARRDDPRHPLRRRRVRSSTPRDSSSP